MEAHARQGEPPRGEPTPAERDRSPWPVVGHAWAVDLLRRTLAPGGPGPKHAYLLSGPPQIGKTTLAQALAQALLCQEGGPDPCGRCRSCRLMERGNHPDFRRIQPLDREGRPDEVQGLLRAEQASQIVREALLRPVEARYKVFLIQEMQRANEAFANKLLKTLEEPPEHVVLCLTAHHRSQVLPTIASRCQHLELRPLDRTTVEQALRHRWKAPPEQAQLLARLCRGRLGWAVERLADPASLEARRASLAELRQLARSGRIQRLAYARELASRSAGTPGLFEQIDLWTSWWRDVMLAQAGHPDACIHVDMLPAIQEDAAAFHAAQVRRYLALLGQVGDHLHRAVNVHLALDVLLLQMPRPVDLE